MKLVINIESNFFITDEIKWFSTNPAIIDWPYPLPREGDIFDAATIVTDYFPPFMEDYQELIYSVQYIKFTRLNGEIAVEITIQGE